MVDVNGESSAYRRRSLMVTATARIGGAAAFFAHANPSGGSYQNRKRTLVARLGALTKCLRNALHSLPGFGRQAFEGLENFLVRHSCAEVSPAIRLSLNTAKLFVFNVRQLASGSADEAFPVEFDLLSESTIDEAADFKIFLNALHDLGLASARSQRLDHQGVKFGVLHLFKPVMFQ